MYSEVIPHTATIEDVKAKDPQEALALQSEYMKAQLAVLQNQAKELSAIIQKSVTPGSI